MTGWLEVMVLAAFMAGLMGGAHCAAMCGGIVCLLNGKQDNIRYPRWRFALAYNAGRILSYTLAGVLAGSAGQAGLLFRGSVPVQQVLMFTAGLTLCLMALYMAGVSSAMRGLEAAGALIWRQVQPLAQRLLPVNSITTALGLGMLWGWLPCGMVYAALLLALSTGNALQGGLLLLAFGLGTLPNMLLMSGMVSQVRRVLTKRGPRLAVAGMLAVVGLYGIFHGMHSGHVITEGLFSRLAPR